MEALVLLRLWCYWGAMTETELLILRGGCYDTFDDYEEIPTCFLLLFCFSSTRPFATLGMDKLRIR